MLDSQELDYPVAEVESLSVQTIEHIDDEPYIEAIIVSIQDPVEINEDISKTKSLNVKESKSLNPFDKNENEDDEENVNTPSSNSINSPSLFPFKIKLLDSKSKSPSKSQSPSNNIPLVAPSSSTKSSNAPIKLLPISSVSNRSINSNKVKSIPPNKPEKPVRSEVKGSPLLNLNSESYTRGNPQHLDQSTRWLVCFIS